MQRNAEVCRGVSRSTATDVADLFGALGDPVRARIASALVAADELCVGDIAIAIDAPENSVSYALRQLRPARLVERRRAGRVIYYRLTNPRVRQLIEVATELAK